MYEHLLCYAWYPAKPEGDDSSAGTLVSDNRKLWCGAGNQIQVLDKSSKYSFLLSQLSSPLLLAFLMIAILTGLRQCLKVVFTGISLVARICNTLE